MDKYTILHRPEELEEQQKNIWMVDGVEASSPEMAVKQALTENQINNHDFGVLEGVPVATKGTMLHDGTIDEITGE